MWANNDQGRIGGAQMKNKQQSGTKYIFVTGGVLSGVGKGITAAAIGAVPPPEEMRAAAPAEMLIRSAVR